VRDRWRLNERPTIRRTVRKAVPYLRVQVFVVVLPLRRELNRLVAAGFGILENVSFVIADDDLFVVVIENVAGIEKEVSGLEWRRSFQSARRYFLTSSWVPQTVGQTPKNHSKRKPGRAFEKIGVQFANAQPAMGVGMTEGAADLKQPEENRGALAFWSREKLLLRVGADDE
jgi:hypothetical protein